MFRQIKFILCLFPFYFCYSDFGGGGWGGGGGGGGGGSGGGYGGSRSDINDVKLQPENFESLSNFEKNFYVEHPAVSAMTDAEVEAYRLKRTITVEGKNVPKPVRTFEEASFPGEARFHTTK